MNEYRADLDSMLLALRTADSEYTEMICGHLRSFAYRLRGALWTSASSRDDGLALAREADAAAEAAGW